MTWYQPSPAVNGDCHQYILAIQEPPLPMLYMENSHEALQVKVSASYTTESVTHTSLTDIVPKTLLKPCRHILIRRRMKMRKIGFPFLMIVLIGLDQFVKAWTVANIELDTVTEFIPGLMSLAYLRNYGAAWSILQNQQWFFTIMTIVAVTGLVWYYIKQIKGNIWTLFSLSLMIAGALGNFIDRLRLGYVVDMFHLDFISFPVFNVADVCLTVGVGILFICIMKEESNVSKS